MANNSDGDNQRFSSESSLHSEEMDPIPLKNILPHNHVCNAYFPEGDERNLAQSIAREEPETKPTLFRRLLDVVWPKFILQHLNYPSFKVVFRSWAQVWVGIVLTIIPASSHWMGGAAYLISIVSLISVSGGASIIMNTLTSLAGFFGVIVSFVHFLITSKIINHIHGGITSDELARQLIEEGSCQLDNSLQDCISDQIFSGRYITTKGAAVSALAIITNTFIVGNMREHLHPLWGLVYVSGQIGICIFMCYGQFSPLFQPLEIGYVVLKPFGLALAIKIVSSLVVFPTTSNWMFYQGYNGILKKLNSAMSNNTRFFKTIQPSAENYGNYKTFKNDISRIRQAMGPLEIVASSVWLEYSFGRFDIGDVAEIRSLLKNLVSSTDNYTYFYELVDERIHFARNQFSFPRRKSDASSYFDDKKNKEGTSTRIANFEMKKREKMLRSKIVYEDEHDRITVVVIDQILKDMQKFSSVFESINHAIKVVSDWLDAANEFRIFAAITPNTWKQHVAKQKDMHSKVFEMKIYLESELAALQDKEKLKQAFISPARSDKENLLATSQGVFLIQVIKYQIEKLLKVLEYCNELDERRPTPKLITFFTKTKYARPRHLFNKLDKKMDETTIHRRNADNLPPANSLQKLGAALVKAHSFLVSNTFWFWIKAGGVIVLGAIPYFIRQTANLYYRKRMIWLVIVIAVSISENVGSSVYIIVARLVYSFFGAILGIVAWYISCGKGAGNYYGYGAVTAVLFLYLMYFRHFSVHQTLLPQILYSVTAALVLGTSWVDAKYNKLANVNYGFEPAYLRFIGVAIGLCVGMLVVLVPRPISSKAIVRKRLSNAISEIGNIHCEVANFAWKRWNEPTIKLDEKRDIVLTKIRYSSIKLASLGKLIQLKYEIPIAGVWPAQKYTKLLMLIRDITQLYMMLLVAFNEIRKPQEWLGIAIKRVGFCYPDIEAEVFATIHMTSDALRTKNALPKITEATISVKHLELLRKQWGVKRISLSERFYSRTMLGEVQVDEATRELDYFKLLQDDSQLITVALLVSHMIYNRLDEIMIVVKGLVGESYDLNDNILIDEDEDELHSPAI